MTYISEKAIEAAANTEGDTEYVRVNKVAYHNLVHRVTEDNYLIRSLRYELSALNRVITRRKKSARELRQRLEDVKRLHEAFIDTDKQIRILCKECHQSWPCSSYLTVCPSAKKANDD